MQERGQDQGPTSNLFTEAKRGEWLGKGMSTTAPRTGAPPATRSPEPRAACVATRRTTAPPAVQRLDERDDKGCNLTAPHIEHLDQS